MSSPAFEGGADKNAMVNCLQHIFADTENLSEHREWERPSASLTCRFTASPCMQEGCNLHPLSFFSFFCLVLGNLLLITQVRRK